MKWIGLEYNEYNMLLRYYVYGSKIEFSLSDGFLRMYEIFANKTQKVNKLGGYF